MSTLSILAGLVVTVLGIGAMWLTWFFDQVRRGERMMVSRTSIKARPERVWSKISDGGTINGIVGLSVQRQTLPDEPDVIETIIGFQGGSSRVLERVIRNDPLRQWVTHAEAIDGQRQPYGAGHWESFALRPGRSATEVVLAQQGDFGSLFSALFSWYCGRRTLRNLKKASEPAKSEVYPQNP